MANVVKPETIKETWSELCEMDQERTRALMGEFIARHPALGGYVLACQTAPAEAGNANPLIVLVLVAWQALTRTNGGQLRPVGPEAVVRAEEANMRILESLEPASEIEQNDTLHRLYDGHHQCHLLAFGAQVILHTDEAALALEPERLGLEMIWLKTVVDCLDQ